jgi:glycosyltransferase involved in cell wall biosynthesis
VHGVDADVIDAGRMRDVTRYARTVRALTRRFKATGAEAVLSWMPKAHFYAGPAAAARRVPAVWYQHGFADPSARSHAALQRLPARGVIATSATVAELQEAMRPRRPTRVVYPAVDPRLNDSAAPNDGLRVRRELGLAETGPVIGSVGRFQRWKGFHLLVEALPALREQWPEIACVIVGGEHPREPDYPALLERRAEELGVGAQLVLPGWQGEVAPWLAAMDVFVLLSRHEPFGMVIVESMAAGTPVVASETAGPREIVTDGVDGLLVDPTDTVQVSGAIARMLRESALRRSVVAAASARAQEFSLERYRHELERAVLELAE